MLMEEISESSSQAKRISKENVRTTLRFIGWLLIVAGLVVLILEFKDIINAQIDYYVHPVQDVPEVKVAEQKEDITSQLKDDQKIVFVDQEFGLFIPKIKANAAVISNVDPYSYNIYMEALEKGIAHAKGTSLPNQSGNVFLFAHSAVNFYDSKKLNVYFYLLSKLEKGDKVYVSYKGVIYKYKVLSTRFVMPSEVKYLGDYMEKDTLTLMSCWPAGTNLKRTIVTAVRD
ncbi:MAG: hypothetical protein UT34_C0002G0243 [candidate division WS6 bacterium GW2011_GWF2_39_15]|uniref:Sortase family protein n=1 Tax=candidate division WS6 bacterium GW2011_GWF2_39_15 TaxID=1619100 RepID=A0A0G0MYW1_9BACT|nr:MAG: hypothetical protein UT34_C0002G0243 [candidate division WS6 bacterium GW2011_GWF2_39_15]